MLVACDSQGKFVNVVDETIIKTAYYCPACKGAVRFKNGTIMRAHFAHVSLEQCQFHTENESKEHLNLKAALYRWGRKNHPVRIEVFLPEFQQIADVLLGKYLALEVQCSPLSSRRLRERTTHYQANGYSVIWLLGEKLWLKKRLTPLQKDFLYFSQNMGFYLWELDEKHQLLRLKYLLHEDMRGHLHYQVREFPFEEGDLLRILRLPYQQQKMAPFFIKQDQDICHYIRQQLYYQHPKWMKEQEMLYQRGDNLLNKSVDDFYPQVKPIQGTSFCQITQDVSSYYRQFLEYYKQRKDKKVQILYPPAFFRKNSADL